MGEMRNWLRKSPAALYAAFAGIALCLDFLADFPVAKSHLVNAVDAVFPLGAAILPWAAWGVIIVLGSFSALKISQWVVDRVGDGPSRRRFQGMGPRLSYCRAGIVSLYDTPSFMPRSGDEIAQRAEVNAEVNLIFDQLRSLRITLPKPDVKTDVLIAYFATMETLADRGELRRARNHQF